MHNDYLKHYNEFGQEVYVGKYNAVYMDEVMRTDYSKASEELKSIQMKCRYGNFNQDGLARLKEITATESDLRTDPEWKNRTTLTGFHYFSSLHPERSNADSKNASALIDYSTASGNGIMKFEAISIIPKRISRKYRPTSPFSTRSTRISDCKCKPFTSIVQWIRR